MTAPAVITGCGVLCAAGVGLDALRNRLASPAAAAPVPEGGDTDGSPEAWPPRAVHPVPDVPLAEYVGRKGTRRLDRMAGMALVASRLALRSAGRPTGVEDADSAWRDGTGVTVGTSTGSIRSLAEIATDTLTQEQPWMIAPSRFPNTVLNSSAGQIAIWNRLRGVNATVAGGQLTGVSSLRYASRMLEGGHVTGMLAGGVEELGPHLAWAWHRSGVLTPAAALGEGCALLVLEAPAAVESRPSPAFLLGTEVGFCPAGDGRTSLAAGLATAIGRLLGRTGVAPDEVDVVSLGSGAQRGARRIEEHGVRLALGRTPQLVRITDALGETYSAAGSMQVAALLARWSGPTPATDRHALVTSLDRDGNVGCALVRRGTPSHRTSSITSDRPREVHDHDN